MFTRTVPQSVRDTVEFMLKTVSEAQEQSSSTTAMVSLSPRTELIVGDDATTKLADIEVTCQLCHITGIKQRGRHVLQVYTH